MAHLGTQISALADGRLGPAATERALGHVAGCAECAAELAATRAARRALAAAMDVPPAQDLHPRLLAVGRSACTPAPPGSEDRSAGLRSGAWRTWRRRAVDAPVPLPGGQDDVPPGCLRGDVAHRAVPVRSLAAVTLGIVVVWLFAVGEEEAIVPERHPASALALLAAADATFVVPAESVQTAATWSSEAAGTAELALPDGYRVRAVHRGAEGLELDVDGPIGTVVVTQQRGRLDERAVVGAPTLAVGDGEVLVLSTAPWHVVWQSGDTVVGVVAGGPTPALEAVLAAYPVRAFDDGVTAQVARGWQVLAGAWSP
jgi:hypothetical protein